LQVAGREARNSLFGEILGFDRVLTIIDQTGVASSNHQLVMSALIIGTTDLGNGGPTAEWDPSQPASDRK